MPVHIVCKLSISSNDQMNLDQENVVLVNGIASTSSKKSGNSFYFEIGKTAVSCVKS